MHRLHPLALGLGLMLVGVSPSPSSSPAAAPAPTPTPNAAVMTRAKSWFAQLQAGQIDRSQLTAEAASQVTDAAIKQTAAKIAPLGTPVTFEQQQTGTQGNVSYTVYLLTFGNGAKLDYVFAVDPHGKIAGLRLAPAP